MSHVFRYVVKSREGFIDAPSEAAAKDWLTKESVTLKKTTARDVFLEVSANPGMQIEVVEREVRRRVRAVAVEPVPSLRVNSETIAVADEAEQELDD